MTIPEDLERGDLLQVEWVDIYEDPAGDPERAELSRRHSIGYYWGRKTSNTVPVLVTTTTVDLDDDTTNSGYCIYPESVVVGVKVIKRKRRKRAKAKAEVAE